MTDLTGLANALRRSLGNRVGVGVTDPRAPGPSLWAEEERATIRMRDTRRCEFAAGRAAARAAMTDIDLPHAAIPMRPDRAPCWPTGLCGSIAHCTSAAVAVVARHEALSGIGIDIEEDTALPPDLWPEILTADEAAWLHRQPEAERGRHAKQIFCAKEAIYKRQYPITEQILGFSDVTVKLGPGSFQTRLPVEASGIPAQMSGLILRIDGFIIATVANPRP